jgi:hypothetical protein
VSQVDDPGANLCCTARSRLTAVSTNGECSPWLHLAPDSCTAAEPRGAALVALPTSGLRIRRQPQAGQRDDGVPRRAGPGTQTGDLIDDRLSGRQAVCQELCQRRPHAGDTSSSASCGRLGPVRSRRGGGCGAGLAPQSRNSRFCRPLPLPRLTPF